MREATHEASMHQALTASILDSGAICLLGFDENQSRRRVMGRGWLLSCSMISLDAIKKIFGITTQTKSPRRYSPGGS
jgi:hypothetical protein